MPKNRKKLSSLTPVRNGAEALLDSKQNLTPEEWVREFQKLFAELRTHQAELELRNEALRKAQEELFLSRSRYVDLYDFSPVGYLTLSPRGIIRRANLTFAAMLQVERDALVGQPFAKLVDVQDQDIFAVHLRKIIDQQTRHLFEIRIPNRKGALLWARLRCIPLKGRQAEDDFEIRVVLSDVSEIKAVQEKLQDNLEMLDAVVESTADGILVLDAAGKVLHANRRFCRMWRIPDGFMARGAEKILLQNALGQLTHPREFLAKVRRLYCTTCDDRDTLYLRDGRIFACYSLPLVRSGTISGRVWNFQDVTERRKMAQALQESHDKLEERVAVRTRELVAAGLKMRKEIRERRRIEKELRAGEGRLERQKVQLEEINTALTVILKRRESDRREIEERVVANIKQLVEPFINKLRKCGLTGEQQNYVALLAKNLDDIVSPFVRTVSSQYLKFTPSEIQVANLIKQGKATKEIAGLMNISACTVNIHRRNIRKKLGISNIKKNLRSFLVTAENFSH